MTRVFVVEDEALIAMELQDQLATMGYEVCGHAARARPALERILTLRPDVVLLDVNLPGGVSGLDLAAELAGKVDAAIVFLTAYDTEVVAATGAGHLSKPFRPEDLRRVIEAARGTMG